MGFPVAGWAGFRAGLRMWNPRWISLASDWTPESRVSTSESSRQAIVIALLFMVQGWLPTGVDSQKNRSDAGDMPRLAPQHTFSARKEPENNGLAGLREAARLFPVNRSTFAPKETVKKPGSETVFQRAGGGQMPFARTRIRTVPDSHRIPDRIPCWTTGSRGASETDRPSE